MNRFFKAIVVIAVTCAVVVVAVTFAKSAWDFIVRLIDPSGDVGATVVDRAEKSPHDKDFNVVIARVLSRAHRSAGTTTIRPAAPTTICRSRASSSSSIRSRACAGSSRCIPSSAPAVGPMFGSAIGGSPAAVLTTPAASVRRTRCSNSRILTAAYAGPCPSPGPAELSCRVAI